jgi:hypothetical protein
MSFSCCVCCSSGVIRALVSGDGSGNGVVKPAPEFWLTKTLKTCFLSSGLRNLATSLPSVPEFHQVNRSEASTSSRVADYNRRFGFSPSPGARITFLSLLNVTGSPLFPPQLPVSRSFRRPSQSSSAASSSSEWMTATPAWRAASSCAVVALRSRSSHTPVRPACAAPSASVARRSPI